MTPLLAYTVGCEIPVTKLYKPRAYDQDFTMYVFLLSLTPVSPFLFSKQQVLAKYDGKSLKQRMCFLGLAPEFV